MAPSSKAEDAAEKGETTPLLISSKESSSVVEPTGSFWSDSIDTFKLGVPIFVAMLSFVGMKTVDTALLGHVSAQALASAALSDLWTMCTLVLTQGRVLGILVGGAIGADNPKLAGIYLQVSLLVLSFVAVFVIVCWSLTEQVWVAFGSDPQIAKDAGYYARVLAFAIPGQVVFAQLSQFFSAQRIMHPEVNASIVALILNLILGLIFVLGYPIKNFDGFGFTACPIVTASMVYLQIVIVYGIYIHIQRLHETCWDGWTRKEITWDRIKTFSGLYFPAALGSSSDFWRVAVVGAVAAKLGEEQVAVFNTSYRIMWIALVLVNALSSAAAIKMNMRLGKNDPSGAKQAGTVGLALSTVVISVMSTVIVFNARLFGRIFTEDENFLTLFEECKWPFSLTLFLMNLAVAIEKIPYSMGRTSDVFWLGLIASWGFQVPAVVLFTSRWRDDLTGLYWGMVVGYFVLCILYGTIAVTSDWNKYARLAVQRSEH